MANNSKYLLMGFKHHKVSKRVEKQIIRISSKPFNEDLIIWCCNNIYYFDYFKVYVEKMKYKTNQKEQSNDLGRVSN